MLGVRCINPGNHRETKKGPNIGFGIIVTSVQISFSFLGYFCLASCFLSLSFTVNKMCQAACWLLLSKITNSVCLIAWSLTKAPVLCTYFLLFAHASSYAIGTAVLNSSLLLWTFLCNHLERSIVYLYLPNPHHDGSGPVLCRTLSFLGC